jgi:hypothetical protein
MHSNVVFYEDEGVLCDLIFLAPYFSTVQGFSPPGSNSNHFFMIGRTFAVILAMSPNHANRENRSRWCGWLILQSEA